MPDSQTGLLKLSPDGTVGITVEGQRHTLRAINMGELKELRHLYQEVQAEVTDYDEFDARPALTDLQSKIKAAKSREAREPLRAKLQTVNDDRDDFIQGQWGRWWGRCFELLSSRSVPESWEPWMVDSPRGIPTLFEHWRSRPLAESGGTAEALALLAQLGQDG